MDNINLEKINNLEEEIDTINFLSENGNLSDFLYYDIWINPLQLEKYKRNIDGYAFKCNALFCEKYKAYISIKNLVFLMILKLNLNYY